MKSRLRLQERLVLLVVATILPLSALSVWFAVRDMNLAARMAQNQLKFAASLVAANQDLAVESAQHLLVAIAALPELRRTERARCQSYFASLRGRYPGYSNIGLLGL